jgi:hypothetical protein
MRLAFVRDEVLRTCGDALGLDSVDKACAENSGECWVLGVGFEVSASYELCQFSSSFVAESRCAYLAATDADSP